MRLVAWIPIVLLVMGLSAGSAAPPAPPRSLTPAVEAVQRGTCTPALVRDLRWLSQDPPPMGPRAAYLLGHCLLALGSLEDAREAFEDAGRNHPTLGAHARLQAGALALERDDAEGVLGLLSDIRPGVSATVLRRAAMMRGEALLRAGRPQDAQIALRDVPLRGADDAVEVELWWLRARAAAGAGDRPGARRAHAMVWWAFPGGEREAEAEDALRALTSDLQAAIPAEARIKRARYLLQRGERKAAEREFALAVREPLPEDVEASIWYELGFLRMRSTGAIEAFTRASRLPRLREESRYYLGQAYSAIGRRREAMAVWERLAAERSPWAARAFLVLGRSAEARGQWAEADRWYERAQATAPQTPSSDEARWRRGWMRYRNGRYAEAERLFIHYANAHPSTPRAAANLYWAARARLERKQDAAGLFRSVAATYPMTFYGQRARERLSLGAPPRRTAEGPRELPSDLFVETYRELAALGFAEEAAREWEGHRADEPTASWRRTSAELWAQAGDFRRAIIAAEPLIHPALYGGRVADVSLWQLAYPRAFWAEVKEQAERYGVDPLLALAIMREESRFDPEALSTARAVGLMQVMPTTASGVLGSRVTPSRLMNPQLNIRTGVAYLGGLLRRFDGSIPLAVAAYNSGPGGVRRVRSLAATDVDRFVMSLPYAETRAYTERVLQSYGIYRWLYE